MASADVRALLLALACALAPGCARSDAAWIQGLESRDPFVRGLAAIALAVQSPEHAAPAVPVLLRTVDRSDVGLEREAAAALVRVGPWCVEPLLDELVADQLMTRHRRGAILNALVAAGRAAADPIAASLRGPGQYLVGDLGEVLLRIGEPAVPALVGLLTQGEDARLRIFAAFLLHRMGQPARAALPALARAASAPDPELRDVARQAIERIGGAIRAR